MRVREDVSKNQSPSLRQVVGGRQRALPVVAALAVAALALLSATPAGASVPLGANGRPIASASTEQCVTSVVAKERSATFVGEMTAVPGTVRMQMRVDVLERGTGEEGFRAISYPGLGQWLRSSPGVKTYRNFNKVSDLFAPATYRAAVHYRWLGSHGRVIRTLYLRTPRCEQPAAPAVGAAARG
jgi:hypothetical protein